MWLLTLCSAFLMHNTFAASYHYMAGSSSSPSEPGYATAYPVDMPAPASLSALILPHPGGLQKTGAKFIYHVDSAVQGNGMAWCNRDPAGSDKKTFHIRPTQAMIAYAPAPGIGNAMLYKTSIQGLYYTAYIQNFKAAYTDFSVSDFYLNTNIITNVTRNTFNCPLGDGKMGGFTMTLTIELYSDATLKLPSTGNLIDDPEIFLTSNGQAIFDIKNDNAGDKVTIAASLEGLRTSFPSCYTAVSNISGNVLNLGEYSITDLQNNKTREVPFSLLLSNCMGIRNIEVRLSSSTVDFNNVQLLGNTIAATNQGATGAGVLITGKANAVSSDMTLRPNNTSLPYKDYEVETLNGGQTYYTQGNNNVSTSQQLNFSATLKATGKPVQAGNFRASGTFTISYP